MKARHAATRRLLAALATLTLSLLGAAAIAPPANAADERIRITGSATCDEVVGEWVITWTLANSTDKAAVVQDIHDVQGGQVLMPQPWILARSTGTATQIKPGTASSSQVRAHVTFDENGEPGEGASYTGSTTFSGTCQKGTQPPCVTAAEATYVHTFDGPKGEAEIRLAGDKPLCVGAQQDFQLVSYRLQEAPKALPQYNLDRLGGRIDRRNPSTKLTVRVPDCASAVYLVWGSEVIARLESGGPQYGARVLGGAQAPGARSDGPKAAWLGGTGLCAAKPSVSARSACDGSVVLTLANGAGATLDAEFDTTGENGHQLGTSVAAGRTETQTVPAASAGRITVREGPSFEERRIVWEGGWTQPADCPTATPPPSSSPSTSVSAVPTGSATTSTSAAGTGGGTLPTTGSSLRVVAGLALALVVAGIGLVALARRRRTSP